MDGDERRLLIEKKLELSTQPIKGTELAKILGVSRQVIVQDIALMRAVNKNILATNKGYMIFRSDKERDEVTRVFHVSHKDSEMEDELYSIVDYGGKVRDVIVEHPIYGQIAVDLILTSRMDVRKFMEDIKKYNTKPLNNLTDGDHYHTVTATNEEILNHIENELMQKGYLLK